MSRLTAFIVSVALALTLVATRSAVVVAGQGDAESDKGEQIQNAHCISCHDLRPIHTQALDKDGWTRVVASMVDKGTELSADDVPPLVAYLVKSHGPLPDGPGKTILLNACTVCHDLGRVRRQSGSRQDWSDTLGSMLTEGAMLSEQDFPVLLDYLTTHFRAR